MEYSDQEEQRKAVSAAEAAWNTAVASRDVVRSVEFLADDVTMFPPGQPPLIGKAAVSAFMADSFATPGFSLSWITDHIAVSTGGDLAYGFARSRYTLPGAHGGTETLDAKGVTIWRRERDGTWQCVVDIWNEAPLLPPIVPAP